MTPPVSDVDLEKYPVLAVANKLSVLGESPIESDNNVKYFSELNGVQSEMIMAVREKCKP